MVQRTLRHAAIDAARKCGRFGLLQWRASAHRSNVWVQTALERGMRELGGRCCEQQNSAPEHACGFQGRARPTKAGTR